MPRLRPAPLVLVLLLAPVLAGCGGDEAPVGGPGGTADGATRYRGTVTVLESPDHGTQLCTAVADSYPPQCSGPDVEGWDWDDVEGEETAVGTTWGSFTVTGTWDDGRLTLTEPPSAPEPNDGGPNQAEELSTPCDPPPGGWAPVEPALATADALESAQAYAAAQPGFAGAWLDQSPNPAASDPRPEERAMNDPTKLVLNLRFTDDLDRHRAAVREVWGGALCVSEAERSLDELRAVAEEVHEELSSPAGGVDVVRGVVDVQVWVAPPDLQAALDARYGEGVVELHPVLRPVG